jgi:hypothetical protein
MCVCVIATLESLQHVSAYMGHLQVIFYKYRNTNSCLKLAPATDPLSMCIIGLCLMAMVMYMG